MQEFDSIRPYSDAETREAVSRLIEDREFLDLIGRFKSPTLSQWLPALVRYKVRRWLTQEFAGVRRVDDIQLRLYHYVSDLIEHSTSRVSYSGMERLDPDKSYLFISNHRDIVFDPMVVNYLLYENGYRTTRIAIGDNLLQNRVFAEIMRLNKSFVVRRNIASPREMRDVYMTLSSFIAHSIENNESIWIAQREGRAKNGHDQTDPAIIKMFYMSRKKTGMAFADAMNGLNIVPVTVAYEYDPCDRAKARELEIKARTGQYVKTPGEDTEQIVKGMTGYKGHVHVHFGDPITHSPDTAKELAVRLDEEMHASYHLHASNLVAYRLQGLHPGAHTTPDIVHDNLLTAENWTPAEMEAAEEEMNRRLAACDKALHPFLLEMYANPVHNALRANPD